MKFLVKVFLNLLRVFEAVGRIGVFALVVFELELLFSAISYVIRKLENLFDVRFF